MIKISDRFREMYPNAHIGLLVMHNVTNPPSHPALEIRKRELEQTLRERFETRDSEYLENTPPFPAFTKYYKKFDKTYHVIGQLKSIVFKDKSIPSVAALVEAMFIAELKNGMLTAGHDLDKMNTPLTVNVAVGNEQYTLMRGTEQALKSGDMFISDTKAILSSIIYGPDQRTQITSETTNVLFTVYAPEEIDPVYVENHLVDIRDLVSLISPEASTGLLQIFGNYSHR